MRKRKQKRKSKVFITRNLVKAKIFNRNTGVLNIIKMVVFYFFSLLFFSQMWGDALSSVNTGACGKGGNTCPNGRYCVYDSLTEPPSYCISGSCVNSPFSSCVAIPPYGLVPCGSGGFMCPTGKTCVKSDGKTPCLSGDCYLDSNSKCIDQSSLLCGKGGTDCTAFSTPEDPKICIQRDMQTPCTSGSCSLFGATCISMNQLGCGKGGTKCDSLQQICVQTDGKTPCLSGECVKDLNSKCVFKTSLECGKGGIACEDGKVCSSPDKRLVVPFDDAEVLNNSSNVCDVASNLLCGYGGTKCEPGSDTVCALSDFSDFCKINQSCTYSNIPALFNTASQKVSGICTTADKIGCSLGGSLCSDSSKKCILEDQSDFCVTSDCQKDVRDGKKKASCQLPSVLPCGKGGFKCPLKDENGNALGCIKSGQSGLCESEDCSLSQASCQPLTLLECGKGGLTCPKETDSTKQTKCIKNDNSSECTDISCSNLSSCQLPSILPCGKGGFSCPISSNPLGQTVCMKNDFSDLCTDESCSKSDKKDSSEASSCQLPENLPCGKGGSKCPKETDETLQTVCMSKDFSAICDKGDCMKLKADKTSDLVCDLPVKLPCGKGGIACADPSQKCISQDKTTVCLSGSCMSDKNYTCQFTAVLPCGKGGASCPKSDDPTKQTVCILKDKTARCDSVDCSADSECQLTKVLPCGNGGTSCPKANNEADQQFCIKADATGICTSGDCMSQGGAFCQLKSVLKCGLGGITCPVSSDPNKQTKCILNDQTSLCTDEKCSSNSQCQLPSVLPCGKGGNFCKDSKLSCINKENTAICNSIDCFDLSTNTCKLATQYLPCGKGGNRCANADLICVKEDLKICNQGESCNTISTSKCLTKAEALCGFGGTKCLVKDQVCAVSNLSGLCKSGSCLNDQKSKCVNRSELPCGLGGSLCVSKETDIYKKLKCILNSQDKECTTVSCMETSSGPNGSFCQKPEVLPCGQGGIQCAKGLVCATNQKQLCVAGDDCMSYKSNTCVASSEIICGFGGVKCPTGLSCAKVDKSGLCTSKESCANSYDPVTEKVSAYCANVEELPCGKGGSYCPTSGQACILNDQSNFCKSGACVNSVLPGNKGASCQNISVLPCGKGGLKCGDGKVCMLKDRSVICTGDSCMQPNISGSYSVMCDLPQNLVCGRGGSYCSSGNICYKADLSAPCTSGTCMLSSDPQTGSVCIPPSRAKCGLGGSVCADENTTCVQKDGVTPCISGACQNDTESKCVLFSALECGKGGLSCPSDKICMYANKSAACLSGSCARANSSGQYSVSCDLPSALACGRGGSKCPNNQICVDEQLNPCASGNCLNASGTVCQSIGNLDCSKGGTKCPIPAAGAARTYCSYRDSENVKACNSSACLKPENVVSCLPSRQITCGLGGIMCPADKICMSPENRACLDGQSCMSDARSTCIDPRTLPCGKGGLTCPQGSGTICAIPIISGTSSASQPLTLCQLSNGITPANCLCVPATQQDCGRGGTRCETGKTCISKEGTLCSEGLCMSDSDSRCEILCGSGGITCLKGSEDAVCADRENKPCILGQTCVSEATTRCILKKNQFCGLGGVYCPNNKVCMKPDRTVCTSDEDCKSQNTSVCVDPSNLGCGLGGTWCQNGQTCLTSTLDQCISGSCMSNPESRCIMTATTPYIKTTVLGTGGVKGSFTGRLQDFSVYQPYQIALMMGNTASAYTNTNGAKTSFRNAGLSLNGSLNLIQNQGNWSFTSAFDTRGNLYRFDGGDANLFFVFAGQYNSNFVKKYNDNDIFYQQSNLKMALDPSGNVYLINKTKKLMKKIQVTTDPASTTPIFGNTADLVPGSTFSQPSGVATDSQGNVYVSDSGNHVIYKYVPSSNTWSVIVGINGQPGYSGDGGPALSARLNAPSGIAVDSNNNLYIADAANQVIRMINSSGVIKTMSVSGQVDNTIPAMSNIKVDIANNVYVQSGDNTIYMFSLG